MLHWFFFILGIVIISLSISNPFFKLFFKKNLKMNLVFLIFVRFLLFIAGLIIIFIGLYIESVI